MDYAKSSGLLFCFALQILLPFQKCVSSAYKGYTLETQISKIIVYVRYTHLKFVFQKSVFQVRINDTHFKF